MYFNRIRDKVGLWGEIPIETPHQVPFLFFCFIAPSSRSWRKRRPGAEAPNRDGGKPKGEHQLKELIFQTEEDHKTNQRMQELLEKLHNKQFLSN